MLANIVRYAYTFHNRKNTYIVPSQYLALPNSPWLLQMH